MALANAATRGLACHNCRSWVLRSFISSIGGQTPPQASTQRRTFSRPARRLNESRERIQKDVHDLEDIEEANTDSNELSGDVPKEQLVTMRYSPGGQPPSTEEPAASLVSQGSAAESSVLWYLQQQPSLETEETSLAARQRIPDLPDYPPEILQPLLQHVSVELGLDSLSLLDLRQLDPPPALGANLLMIIGTARSEKHLHVSADRLCRWLRTEYKMRPFADGLLGRNELKIKMRRKAKRARLMSAVGAKSTGEGDMDDGIRTGWVCVNLGRVAGGELPEEMGKLQRAEGIVGFGAHSTGSNIVVQMMTEEKRGEIDLEKLWTGIMNRARREKDKDDREAGIARDSDGATSATRPQPAAEGTRHYRPQAAGVVGGQQVRAYHTQARRMEEVRNDRQPGHRATEPMRSSTGNDQTIDGSAQKLNSLLKDLLAMPHNSIAEALQPLRSHTEREGTAQTQFLNSFYEAMPSFPGLDQWHAHLTLFCVARRFGVPDIDADVLVSQLRNLKLSGHVPEERTYHLVIRSLLRPSGDEQPYSPVTNPVPSSQLDHALCLMEEMEAHGYNAYSPPILSALHEATVGPTEAPTLDAKTLMPAFGIARLRTVVTQDDWPGFWKTWRSYPRRFLPRTGGMYSVLFEAIAEDSIESTQEARDALREAWGSMQAEWPAVDLDAGLAQVLLRAVEAVEPEDTVEAGRVSEWAEIRKLCMEAMRRE